MLPIEPLIPQLYETLAAHRNLVLQAPPGAGKTTRVPLALLDQTWLAGQKILLLEPRRLAARSAARFMARNLGERVGQTVGYRVRLDSQVGPDTRVEVVTEGVLARMLQSDPALEGYGIVIFDEFHERSLDADLGLALCLDSQAALRPDLRLLVMSATLDTAPIAKLLGDAPAMVSEGKSFPVTTHYAPIARDQRLAPAVAATLRQVLARETGNLLVFLPGAGEIRAVERLLTETSLDKNIHVNPLYGNLTQAQQDEAIAPTPPGVRKVVLATSIAETSLTIEGIRVVIDAGLMRVPRFDPTGGMTRLETVRVSQASADQRRGRAGRLEPGICYRLWSEASHPGLAPHNTPEIVTADCAGLALDLAQWGIADPKQLRWLDPPPAAAFAQSRELLQHLGALDPRGVITAHGKAMAELGLHPRLAHMLLQAKDLKLGGLACQLAALLSERDIIKFPKGEGFADVRLRLETLAGAGPELHGGIIDRPAVQRVRQAAEQLQRQLRSGSGSDDPSQAGLLLAFAYPDRIAQRRGLGGSRYRLANGRGTYFANAEPLAREEFLVAAELDGDAREAKIFLAAPLSLADLKLHFAGQLSVVEFIGWDERERVVLARRQTRLDELVLGDEPLPNPAPDQCVAALLKGMRSLGLESLPWTRELRDWQARVLFLRGVEGESSSWPDVSDAALLAGLEAWLAPYLNEITRREHFERIDLESALKGLLSWDQQRQLEELAPTHLQVPSGSRIRLDYSEGSKPVLAVRLQELFGLRETPRVAGGRAPVMLHLLSPAHRPVQVTQDLASFWKNTYPEVRKDLKGRYPKHYWPDDPLQAEPTSRAKRRGT
jgi:ATP-dependent helicase HrpB